MKNLLLTVCAMLLAVSIIQAQEVEEKKGENQKHGKLHFKVKGNASLVKGGAEPDIYVDGKKFDFELELLDQEKIESVVVIKGEQAITEYGAPNGVVLIKTKKKTELNNPKIEIRATRAMNSEEAPVIIIDGKVVSGKETLENLSPDDVEKIKIVKDKQTMEKYNAPNGVVIITTKKGKKRKK